MTERQFPIFVLMFNNLRRRFMNERDKNRLMDRLHEAYQIEVFIDGYTRSDLDTNSPCPSG